MKERAVMMLEKQSKSEIYVSYDYTIRWQAPDGSIRDPEEAKRTFPYPGVFLAGGAPSNSFARKNWMRMATSARMCTAGRFLPGGSGFPALTVMIISMKTATTAGSISAAVTN